MLFSFVGWLQGRGLTRCTGYRYRKQGLIKTVNVFGRLYVARSEIESFERRALNGEFTLKARTPNRHRLKAASPEGHYEKEEFQE